MTITMNDDSVVSVEQVRELVKLGRSARFNSCNKEERCEWIGTTLAKLRYFGERKKNRSIIKEYIVAMTGYSPSMVDKMIARKKKTGRVFLLPKARNGFPAFYTKADVELLAEVNNLYLGQNGYALKKTCEDMLGIYGDSRFERLSHISVSHLYNLKQSERFKSIALTYTKTDPVSVAIGERRKPEPEGKPGSIRVDSVHQGDLDKVKGVYHINLVDEVTQAEVVTCVERISEYYLESALEDAISQFPFKIWNFHSDNGSEYINKTVAKLLNKLHVTQTKSRPRKSNDNALVECKNGAVIRKEMGKLHIPKGHAKKINRYYREHLNPFLFFHRYCAFPTEEILENGKIIKRYKQDDYATPLQRLCSLENPEQYMKDNLKLDDIKKQSLKQSHLEAAKLKEEARSKLLKKFKNKP
jgi:hypothetical protein